MSEQHYVVDWDKVETFEDLKRIIKVFGFNISMGLGFPGIENIKDLVHLEDKPSPIVVLKRGDSNPRRVNIDGEEFVISGETDKKGRPH